MAPLRRLENLPTPGTASGANRGRVNGNSRRKLHPLRECNQEGKLLKRVFPVRRGTSRLSGNPELISCKDDIFKIFIFFCPSAFEIDFKTRLLKKLGNGKF